MKTKFRLLAAALISAFALQLSALGQAAAEPVEMLRNTERDLLGLVYDTPNPENKTPVQLFRPVVKKYFDPVGITRRVIGPAWRGYTPEQRERIVTLFTDLILRSYVENFEPASRPVITYGESTVLSDKPPRTEVATILEYEGKKYNVAYRVEKTAAGWRIYDIIGEGVSLIGNYNSQFKSLTSKGAGAVIKALEKNIADFEAARKKAAK